MNILILGDVMGRSGRAAISKNLPDLIANQKIDFVVINGENSGDRGVGITEEIFKNLISAGADVVTTGNHVWDESGTTEFIAKEKRLLRPLNLIKGSPGNGYGVFNSKNKKKIGCYKYYGKYFY